jgi:hypothetical protein
MLATLIHNALLGAFVGALVAIPLLLTLPGVPRRIPGGIFVALALAALPSLALAAESALDVAPIVDGVVTVFPQVAPWILLAQWVGGFAAPLAKRKHRTWLHTGLSWLASLPARPALPPAAPAYTERR